MPQVISFELDDRTRISAKQLHALSILAMRFDGHDIRVTDDSTNIKAYVGPHYKEQYRFWIKNDDVLAYALIEKDHAVDSEDSDWRPAGWDEATDDLIRTTLTHSK